MWRPHWGWVLSAIVTASVLQPLRAARVSEGPQPRLALPKVVTEAIMLLGWSGDEVPPIAIVDRKPPDATETVEAWVRFNDDGSAMRVIYVRTDSDVYREAARSNYQALIRLAGILAHERWHLRHGRDEVGAYTAQLSAMEYLHANSAHLAGVRQALRRATQQAGNSEKASAEGR